MAAGAVGSVDLRALREIGRSGRQLVERYAVSLGEPVGEHTDPASSVSGGASRFTRASRSRAWRRGRCRTRRQAGRGRRASWRNSRASSTSAGGHDPAVHDADAVFLGGEGGGGGDPDHGGTARSCATATCGAAAEARAERKIGSAAPMRVIFIRFQRGPA